MKNILSALILVSILISACNNQVNDSDKLDSIAAEKAADSMLKEAIAGDTIRSDGTSVDSSLVID